jgi:hypothetical protein
MPNSDCLSRKSPQMNAPAQLDELIDGCPDLGAVSRIYTVNFHTPGLLNRETLFKAGASSRRIGSDGPITGIFAHERNAIK